MNWGYYCRTCGESSRTWFESPVQVFKAYHALIPKIEAMAQDLDVTLPTTQIPLLVFLSSHSGHDLWAECDIGVLRLCAGRRPGQAVDLPRFADEPNRQRAGFAMRHLAGATAPRRRATVKGVGASLRPPY